MLHHRRTTRVITFMLALVFSLSALLPVSKPVLASGLPSALFDANSVGWASVRNMTQAAFQAYFDARSAEGYMLIDTEVDVIGGQLLRGGVFQKNLDGRGWASHSSLTSSEFSAKWTQYKNDNYRLIDQETYVLGGVRYYAGVWIQNKENLAWASYRNVSSADFSAKFQTYKNAGYIPVDVEAYPFGSSTAYAAVWVKNAEGLKWQLWRDMSSTGYAEKFDLYKSQYRVADLESYMVGGQQRYAAIWIENKNGRSWYAYRDMTSKAFGDKWAQLWDAGYRLVNYEVYPTADGVRYAGIWRQNSSRPNWALKNAVTAYLQSQAELYDIPGMSVAIAEDGQFVYLRGFGYADVDDQKIATSQTIFRLASVSKAVAGVLTMRLVEQNEFALNDFSRTHVPQMPAHQTHRIRHLVSNRSGVGHYDELGSPPNAPYATALLASATLWNAPLSFAPGTGYKYSTHAFTLLGAVMEAATGQTINTIVTSRITNPQGLTTLRPEDRSVANANRATLYQNDNDEATPDNISWKVLGGGLESSGYDLARFGVKLLNGSILSAASRTTMWTPPDGLSADGLGWKTGSESGTPVVAKDGAQLGANSYIRIYPDKNIVITVLTNRKGGGHSAPDIGRKIGQMMLAAEAVAANTQEMTAVSEVEQVEMAEPAEVVDVAVADDAITSVEEATVGELASENAETLVENIITVDTTPVLDGANEQSTDAAEDFVLLFLPLVQR